MKRNVGRTLMVLGFAAMTLSGTGCHLYRDLVDTCYPQRYTYQAHQEVIEACAPQVRNGHILDQTIWNYHFKKGTADLTPSGRLHLTYLARRRPRPDSLVFLQAAADVTYDAKKPQDYVKTRNSLNAERVKAITTFLSDHTAGRGLSFEVVVHDPSEVGQAAVPIDNAIRQMYGSSTATLPGGVSGTIGGASTGN